MEYLKTVCKIGGRASSLGRWLRHSAGCLALLTAFFGCSRSTDSDGTQTTTDTPSEQEVYRRYVALEQQEKQAAGKYWPHEMLAQQSGEAIERLWDELNRSTNKLITLGGFPIVSIRLPEFGAPTESSHGIAWQESISGANALSPSAWRDWLGMRIEEGWKLEQVELRHIAFDTNSSGKPASSRFYVFCGLWNSPHQERVSIEGEMIVSWGDPRPNYPFPSVARVEPGDLTLLRRKGNTPFSLIFDQPIYPPEKSPFIDPLILYDLDGDGSSEIILAAKNQFFRLQEGQVTEGGPLCRINPGNIMTAVIGDFDRDGRADFLAAKREGLLLYSGGADGSFVSAPRMVWSAAPSLQYALAITSGDIDADGDLDLWLTQYKLPYLGGQLPTPYYDANDGYPSYLLVNDGLANFTDATESSGLSKKRFRRTYSASFLDLDGDLDLDLAVISDFYGIDLYLNYGTGRFADVTKEWVEEPYAAGMGHSFGDFNRDGLLDLLMIGMHSPTVDRLEHSGITRDHPEVDHNKRRALMFGNRLLMGREGGGFSLTPLSRSIARSGWSWGSSAFDFDNDRFPDVYIANGHETNWQVKDYEEKYWLHDLYIGTSSNDPANLVFFSAQGQRTRGGGHSYGGWDRNRFYLNEQGKRFREVGFVLGVSLQQDSRNVATDDLDGDGRVDLLVTTFEAWPEQKQTLKIYRNVIPEPGNWISVRLLDQPNGSSPTGASVTLYSNGQKTVRRLVTGDSFRTQHANTVHFGLGALSSVEHIEVHAPNGKSIQLAQPAINRSHDLILPK